MGGFGRQFLVWWFLGFGFLPPFDHPGCLEYPPPPPGGGGGAISKTLCVVSSSSRKIGGNLKKLDCALFL